MSRDLSELCGLAELPDDNEATSVTKAVLLSLCAHANHKTHRTHVGIARQCRAARCSDTSARKAHRLLAKWGAIEIEERPGRAHVYTVSQAWLEARVPTMTPEAASGVTPQLPQANPRTSTGQPPKQLRTDLHETNYETMTRAREPP